MGKENLKEFVSERAPIGAAGRMWAASSAQAGNT